MLEVVDVDDKVYESLSMKKAVEEATPAFREYFRKEEGHYSDLCRGARVLEMGAGGGRIMAKVAPYASEVVGVDTNEWQIREGKEVCKYENTTFYKMDACSTEFGNGEFDVVLIPWNFLGALSGKAFDALIEARRILRKDGILSLTVYAENADKYQKEYYPYLGLNVVDIGKEHVRFVAPNGIVSESKRFSIESLEILIKGAGFDPEITRIGKFAYLVEAMKESD